MSDSVGGAFSRIYEQYRVGWTGIGSSEHLRGDQTGTVLYTHGAFSFSGWSDDALKGRQQKWAQGAEIVRQAIDNEFGNGVGDAVFARILHDDGRDLGAELLRGDLERVRQTINEVVPGAIPGLDGPTVGTKVGQAGGGTAPLKPQLDENQRAQAKIFCVSGNDAPGTVTRGQKADAMLTAMFGRSLSDAEVRGLGAIPDGCDVDVQLSSYGSLDGKSHPGVSISKSGRDPSGAFKAIAMTVYRGDDGKVRIYRDSTRTDTSSHIGPKEDVRRPTNLGACALVRQAVTAQSLGVETIHNFATRGKGYNGYYTWARCGGNAPLTTSDGLRDEDVQAYRKFRQALESSTHPTLMPLATKKDLDVQDLMKTEVGRQFWQQHGFPVPLEFDLRPGSKTMDMFQAYTVPKSCFQM
jgi:hypothetical protein